MADILKAGIIGMDTSHARVFTETFNDEKAAGHVDGIRVVAACGPTSPDIAKSIPTTEEYKKLLPKWGVKIVDDIDEVVKMSDVLLIESVDGRRHLPELKRVADAGKPIYIDKPFAASLADAKEMVRILRDKKIPCYSSSALRFEPNVQKFVADKAAHGKVLGCDAYSPAHLHKTNPGFFWYGIHGVEILYTIMGPGCKSVRCTSTGIEGSAEGKEKGTDVAVGIWSDGRIGTMRGMREGASGYGAFVMCEKAIVEVRNGPGNIYAGMLREMVKFFQTGKAPVPLEETLEICAFIDAAWKSSQEKCGDVAVDATL